ncbi:MULTISPECIES: hypothetical protein [unclassified Nocardia]|uniref:hypothetical protein n=1 Tax=unclassified Nocardia TaxID=2637762 RepID=UPI001CE41F34|nr:MULTISPECIES: hypothetical protein [unclassified Nocardia]
MFTKAITFATIAVGAALTVTGVAHADDAPDPTQYSDHTADFVNSTDPAALNAKADGKQLIVSPYGTRSTIACRGDGVALYDCKQADPYGFGWIVLDKQETPLGTAWVHIVP